MEIDIKTVGYDVELMSETGACYLLNGALIRLRPAHPPATVNGDDKMTKNAEEKMQVCGEEG